MTRRSSSCDTVGDLAPGSIRRIQGFGVGVAGWLKGGEPVAVAGVLRGDCDMACPTCGHTMASLCGNAEGGVWVRRFLCERCGTVTVEHDGEVQDTYAPKLVERCREFAKNCVRDGSWLAAAWNTAGIDEAICLPEERKA